MRNNLYRYFLRFVIALSIVFVIVILGSVLIVSSSVRQQNLSAMHTVAELIDSLIGTDLEAILVDEFDQSRLGDSPFIITLFSTDGTVLADSRLPIRNQWIPENTADLLKVEGGEFLAGEGFSALHQLKIYRLLYPIERNGRVIALIQVALPQRLIIKKIVDYTAPLILFSLVLFLLAAAYILSGIRALHRPIIKIITAARHFSSGELDYPLSVVEPAELHQLSKILNGMAAKIADRLAAITQQRNEFEAMLEGMVESVVVLDPSLSILEVNRAAVLLAARSKEGLIGKKLIEVFRNSRLQQFAEKLRSTGEHLETEISFSAYNPSGGAGHHGAGQERYLQVHGSVIRSSNGADPEDSRRRLILVMHDMTRIREVEQIRKDFVANVSHELKTPITSIKGFVETLLDGAIDDRKTAVRFLEIIHRQSDQLNAVIEDLLSLSRLEATGNHLEMREQRLSPILVSALESCRIQANEKSIDLILSSTDYLRCKGNSVLLEQALVNLIENAIKYSREDTKVWIHTDRDQETGEIRIGVKDQGPGIPEEDLPRIFERFYRVDKARSRDMGGTGLGLSIVKHIVLSHNGRVAVESEYGKGTEFTLALPDPATQTG